MVGDTCHMNKPPFPWACIICEQVVDNLSEHYKTHTIDAILTALLDVSECLAKYGEYA